MTLPSKAEIEAERARRSLSYYIPLAWKVVEPTTPFLNNWHIGLISEYLTALTQLQIQNLIINIPPRHMKSLQAVVMWPTWVWINDPSSRWLTGSYAFSLAVRDALKSRRIIQSDWYQELFGHIYQLVGDQNAKSRYENDKTGMRMPFGMDGMVIGEGGDYVIVDDSLKAQDADSDAVRNSVNETWDGSLSTRANDPKTVRRLLIGQRLHEDDLPGHVLEKMKEEGAHQYELLCLPARYEPNRFFSGIGLKDPRTTPGELLWPEKFDDKELTAMELDLGTRGTAGQLQQRPAPAGGLVYLREWWDGINRYDPSDSKIFNRNVARWLFWDTAFKDEEQNDTTALSVFELTPDYRIMLRYAWWDRLQFPQLSKAIEREAKRWNYDEKKLRGVIIEEKGSGISVLQSLKQSEDKWIAGIVGGYNPGVLSKEERARLASPWCEKGCVLLPIPDASVEWLFDAEDMLFKFPASRLKDFPDTFSMAILHLDNLLSEGWKLRTAKRK